MEKTEMHKMRDDLGWTQREVADFLDVTVTTISRWEHKVKPHNVFLKALRREWKKGGHNV